MSIPPTPSPHLSLSFSVSLSLTRLSFCPSSPFLFLFLSLSHSLFPCLSFSHPPRPHTHTLTLSVCTWWLLTNFAEKNSVKCKTTPRPERCTVPIYYWHRPWQVFHERAEEGRRSHPRPLSAGSRCFISDDRPCDSIKTYWWWATIPSTYLLWPPTRTQTRTQTRASTPLKYSNIV